MDRWLCAPRQVFVGDFGDFPAQGGFGLHQAMEIAFHQLHQAAFRDGEHMGPALSVLQQSNLAKEIPLFEGYLVVVDIHHHLAQGVPLLP